MDTTTTLRPSQNHRVASKIAPSSPIPIRKLAGNSMTPTVLESTKNKRDPEQCLVQRHTRPLPQPEALSYDSSPFAFQPRDLPLGLLRGQAETRAHHRQRR